MIDMKILVTHEIFPPEKFGGGERILWEFLWRLRDKGFDIRVLTTGNPKIREYEGVPTIRIPINRFLMNLALPQIIKHAKDADLIQTVTYNACLPSYVAAKMLKKPVTNFVMGLHRDIWNEMRGPILGTISKWGEKMQLFHNYDKVIFFSEFSRSKALESGMPRKITEVVLPGVDHKSYYCGKKEDYVLFVGRLAKQKGVEYLIEAAKELPDVKIKLAGDGELRQYLESVAPPNVEFLGHQTGQPLYDLYAKAPIFCLPSISDDFGLVNTEAMASGCAVVSTVPLNYSGIKIKSRSKDDIVNAISRLHKNPKLVGKMKTENLKKAKEYDWNKFTKKMIKIYDELVKR